MVQQLGVDLTVVVFVAAICAGITFAAWKTRIGGLYLVSMAGGIFNIAQLYSQADLNVNGINVSNTDLNTTVAGLAVMFAVNLILLAYERNT